MLSEKERNFQPHVVSLEAIVPEDNFYREVEDKLDLTFVRDMVRHLYAPFGRPGVDPVVFFKLQLIMFFEGIRSERQLMDTVAMRLDCRWYIAYDLNENVPDHSALSKIRDRFGITIFQQFFEHIVQLCIDADLVWGQEFYFDSSMVLGNASFEKQVPRFYWNATQEHLEQLFADDEPPVDPAPSVPTLVQRYDGTQAVVKGNSYKKQADYWVNPVDPSASPLGHDRRLGQRLHYVVDGGKSRIILACLVTPSAIQDQTPMLDLAWWSRFRWHTQPSIAVADAKYGTGYNLAMLEQNGITAFIPPFKQAAAKRAKRFPKSMFTFDPAHNCYICPQGQTLTYRNTYRGVLSYKAKPKICRACPVKAQCTTHKWGRIVSHSIYKPWEDRVMAYLDTPAYKKAMRKRQVWIEPRFAEVKQWHEGRRFRLRGMLKVNIEALFKAAGLNIKQLLKGKSHQNRPKPPANMAALRRFPAIISSMALY